jgi:hypothetical protein
MLLSWLGPTLPRHRAHTLASTRCSFVDSLLGQCREGIPTNIATPSLRAVHLVALARFLKILVQAILRARASHRAAAAAKAARLAAAAHSKASSMAVGVKAAAVGTAPAVAKDGASGPRKVGETRRAQRGLV